MASPSATRSPDDERVIKVFNTALVATQSEDCPDLSQALHETMRSPAFQAILAATRQLAEKENIKDQDAAELVIRTFRKMDSIWRNYVFQEGISKLKSPNPHSMHPPSGNSRVMTAKFSE